MKRLTRAYIEGIADRILKAYMNLPEIKGNDIYRIDPELLLTRVLGLKIEYAHLSLDGTVLGILGHTNASFTLDTYTHITVDMKRNAANVVGGFMSNIVGDDFTLCQNVEKKE